MLQALHVNSNMSDAAKQAQEEAELKVILYLPFITQFLVQMTLKEKAFENIVSEGENAGYQDFLLFSQCFLCTSFDLFSTSLVKR